MSKVFFLSAGAILLIIGMGIVFVLNMGRHSGWVTLQDPGAHFVSLASDPEALGLIVRSQPSPTWQRLVTGQKHSYSVIMDEESVRAACRAARRTGRIIDLPNGTHGELLNRMEFDGTAFLPITAGTADKNSSWGRLEVVQIRVREGQSKEATGWTLPDLMQHEVSWP